MTQSLVPTHPGTPSTVPSVQTLRVEAVDVPGVPTVLLAVAGLLAFGACVGLGAPALSSFTATALVPVAGLVGAAVLTGPALVAGQIFLRPHVGAELPVAALGRGLAAAGSLGAGMAPLALFLVATSGLWPLVLLAGFAVAGIGCAAVTIRTLTRAAPGGLGFIAGWIALASLVALRIAFAVGSMAMEGVR